MPQLQMKEPRRGIRPPLTSSTVSVIFASKAGLQKALLVTRDPRPTRVVAAAQVLSMWRDYAQSIHRLQAEPLPTGTRDGSPTRSGTACRGREIAALASQLQDGGRLLTLTGVGKTRLATVRGPVLVASTTMRALGHTQTGECHPCRGTARDTEQLDRAARGRPTLSRRWTPDRWWLVSS